MIRRWDVRLPSANEESLILKLSTELNINPILSKLLVYRDIHDYDTAKQYFNPSLNDMHDPFEMKHMKKAVKRINKALGNKEKVLVYGDYDVDGITAVAVVYTLLRKFTSNLAYYIPDRDKEGYGISKQGVDFAEENGYTLVIALDCGIKAENQVLYAKEKGIDFIIGDHHTPGANLPKAKAILDPKREDCNYPFKELSGCGVGFKLMHAFYQSNGFDFEDIAHCMDMVAVSIASDIVPIMGENRVLAHFGLKQLSTKPRIGLRTILDSANLLNKDITISDIVFKVGPRLNASGRVCSAMEAVELLISTDYEHARKKCKTIDDYNQARRDLDTNMTAEALKEVKFCSDLAADKKSTVLYNPEWHKGVIGIVASRLIENYHRPTVILTKSNGVVTGSARSVPGFDLYSAILSCQDLLVSFGGHKFAAGLNMLEENVPLFIERFEKYVSEHITDEQQVPTIDIDAEIGFNVVTDSFMAIINRMRPFGPDNPKPTFTTRRLRDAGRTSLVGIDKNHVRLELVDEMGIRLVGIAFGQSDMFAAIKAGEYVDICYHVEENTFKGKTNIQLMVKDIKAS